jgi:lysophospholipase
MGMTPGAGKWPLRSLTWPSKTMRGSLLFLGGRGDIIEKYLESMAHWHDEGWHVTAFDWRGQGGSGRLSADRHVGHAQSFAPWINDLATVFDRLRAKQSGPHVIIAHSMGGHLVLRALIENRIAPDAVVLIAPMLGFDTKPLPNAVAAWVAERMCRMGSPERAAWKKNEKPVLGNVSRQSLLTNHNERYEDELWWKQQHPELELGPPSWSWVAEAYRSTRAAAEPGVMEAVTTPVLLIGTDGDRLVNPRAIRTAAHRLPHSELKMFDKSVGHEILRERDEPRDLALLAIDVFLKRTAHLAK